MLLIFNSITCPDINSARHAAHIPCKECEDENLPICEHDLRPIKIIFQIASEEFTVASCSYIAIYLNTHGNVKFCIPGDSRYLRGIDWSLMLLKKSDEPRYRGLYLPIPFLPLKEFNFLSVLATQGSFFPVDYKVMVVGFPFKQEPEEQDCSVALEEDGEIDEDEPVIARPRTNISAMFIGCLRFLTQRHGAEQRAEPEIIELGAEGERPWPETGERIEFGDLSATKVYFPSTDSGFKCEVRGDDGTLRSIVYPIKHKYFLHTPFPISQSYDSMHFGPDYNISRFAYERAVKDKIFKGRFAMPAYFVSDIGCFVKSKIQQFDLRIPYDVKTKTHNGLSGSPIIVMTPQGQLFLLGVHVFDNMGVFCIISMVACLHLMHHYLVHGEHQYRARYHQYYFYNRLFATPPFPTLPLPA